MADQYSVQSHGSDDGGENILSQYKFSKKNINEVFKVMMTESLMNSTPTDPSDHIIVWKTTSSRRNRHIGSYCCVKCNTNDFQLNKDINGPINQGLTYSTVLNEKLKVEFIGTYLKVHIRNRFSKSGITMKLDIFLMHVLIYRQCGNTLSYDNYNTNIVQQLKESLYSSDSDLAGLISGKDLVKTAKKSIGGGGIKRTARTEQKYTIMEEVLKTYRFEYTHGCDIDALFNDRGYEALCAVLLLGLDKNVIQFINRKLEMYVR